MEDHGEHFEYESLPNIPKEFRCVDRTYIEVCDKPFAEGERALRQLQCELCDSFAESPFAYLHLSRAIEDRLLLLAVDTRQPIAKCLEHLRKRLDLEYNQGEISGKASTALIVARYAADSGKAELAKSLLEAEREHLEQIAGTCQACLDSVSQRIHELSGPGASDV